MERPNSMQEQLWIPLSTFFVSILGDFNFREAEKPVTHVASFKMDWKEPKYPKQAKQLRGALSNSTRIEQDALSHFNLGHNYLNDIDFIYVSTPGWAHSIVHYVQSRFPKGFPCKGP